MKINLLTYNLAMLPFKTRMSASRARAAAFLEVIREKSPYHILCLQEVFDEKIRELLKNGLNDEYPYIVEKVSDHDIINQDSGLFFASKFPVLRHTFREFDTKSIHTVDVLADKGIFVAVLSPGTEEEKILHVYNTHLQSGEPEIKTRRKQLSQAGRFIFNGLKTEGKNSDFSKISAVLLGDFNVVGDSSEEYHTMIKLLGYPRDLYHEKNPGAKGYTWDSLHNRFITYLGKDDRDMQRLDYIFAFDRLPGMEGSREPEGLNKIECLSCDLFKPKARGIIEGIPECDLSDHYGVETVIEIP